MRVQTVTGSTWVTASLFVLSEKKHTRRTDSRTTTQASLVVDSARSLDPTFELCLPVRIAAYQLEAIDLSLAQSLPATASSSLKRQRALCANPLPLKYANPYHHAP